MKLDPNRRYYIDYERDIWVWSAKNKALYGYYEKKRNYEFVKDTDWSSFEIESEDWAYEEISPKEAEETMFLEMI